MKKAKIIKSGKIITGKAADVFVKVGVAEYIEEEIAKKQIEVKGKETVEEKRQVETPILQFEKNPVVKKKGKKRGRKPNKK